MPKSREINGVVVESGVPVPSAHGRRWPFAQMNVGESIVVEKALYTRAAGSAYAVGRKHGMKFSIRQEAGGVRIWRTA